ncbi:MAG: circadian clock protein KaiC [Proteobacteria bacterium]|nr:circadian clock protein KaiC [Pseudomonadota bacterium]
MMGSASTGIPGLDHILGGGLSRRRLFLIEGSPGSGKTTLAMQFLLEGAARGERTLYITLSETVDELEAVARSHGWSLDGIELFELANLDGALGEGRDQTVLHPWEIELGETVKLITDSVDRAGPSRVVFDSLSELRLLAQDALRYRRQVLALKQYFAAHDTTVLMVDDLTGERPDGHLHSLCHGVITVSRRTLDYGAIRRRLEVQKLRGVDFRAGWHDFQIRTGGLVVYPRLVASDFHKPFVGEPVASGVAELDEMLDGGPSRGTCTLVTGPAGSGKTNLGMQYVAAACARGERCAIYEFDERIGTLLARARDMGSDFEAYMKAGLLDVRQVDPAETSPGEFSSLVRNEVENHRARIVMIDSLAGYMAAMAQEQHLQLQMHELLAYLNQQGVVTLLINPQQSLVGSMSTSGLNVSYMADAVLLLRYFEADARVRKAITVIKNRGGPHEDSIRELRIDRMGVRIGQALNGFKGVLTGVPKYVGETAPLMEARGEDRR